MERASTVMWQLGRCWLAKKFTNNRGKCYSWAKEPCKGKFLCLRKRHFLECGLGGSLSQFYIYHIHVRKLGELHHLKHTWEEGYSGVVGMNVLNVQNSGIGTTTRIRYIYFPRQVVPSTIHGRRQNYGLESQKGRRRG